MKRIVFIVFVLLCALCVLGCPPVTPDPDPDYVTGIGLDSAAKALAVGATAQLTASVYPATATDAGVTWSSSAEGVATVSSTGLVAAVAAGSATISVTTTDGGYTAECAVLVYTHGSLDVTFNADGIASIANADGYAVAVQTDGKIVVGGTTGEGGDCLLARFDADDGGLDSSFGTGGKVITDLGGSDYVFATALQSDGKIVAAGFSDSAVMLLRYTTNGALDTGFGSGGVVTVALPESMIPSDSDWGLAIQDDGKIVIAGGAFDTDNFQFVVARYDASGALDDAFDEDGFATFDVAADDDYAKAAAVTASGVIAAGCASAVAGAIDFALARFDSDGNLDTGFGSGGAAVMDMSGEADILTALALQSDGKAVVVGYSAGASDSRILLARYGVGGGLDATFGTAGIVAQTVTTGAGSGAGGQDLALQADGKILVIGDAAGSNAVLLRYATNGALDAGFGDSGIVLTHVDDQFDLGRGIALQDDGRIIVVGSGYSSATGSYCLTLARYWP
jgi:uncharacterized delta-60 repeat protein